MIVQRTPLSAVNPFVLADVQRHLRVTDADMMAESQAFALAAVKEFEAYAQVALIDQTITVTLEEDIRRALLQLPIAPMIDPLSVTVVADGVAFAAFAVIAGQRPALRFTDVKPCGLVVIQYKAGFGPAVTDVPQDIKLAIADQAAAYFDQRGAADGKTVAMSPHMARIAARYRRVSL